VVSLGRVVGGIAAAGFSVFLFVGVLVLIAVAPFPLAGRILLLPAWFAAAVVLGWLGLYWPVLEYRRTWYRVNNRGIEIRRGVVWREVVTVPRSRVQHTDVSQGPIERTFELATLVIHTAGTEHASVSLSGLEATTALAIRDFLIAGTGQDAV
jgi:membrane protein YdbS with pleckstrin-like domain